MHFHFILKLVLRYGRLSGLTKRIAEIIVDIFKDEYEICLDIKEPNDIFYNGKKLGGILTESKILSNKVKYVVIGIGINTNKVKFNDELKNIATSIKNEFDIIVDTKDFITSFCNRFESVILELSK